jgi:hypothetical protein
MIDSNDSIALKDALTVASPFIKSIVDTFVTPKLEAFRDKNKNSSKNLFIPTEENFSEYFHRTYKKLIVLNTLVFNNSQRFLNDIFLPLTLTPTNNRQAKIKVNGFPETISNEYGNVLITDTAGMGKSTLMKKIFIDSIHGKHGIPIFIELRRLNKNKTILNEIQEQLNSINKDFDSDLLLNLLAEGGFILILDGYDEISLSDREIVTQNLQEFISKTSNNLFFITSRPERALSSFGNFQEFKIEALSKKEAFELLRKYDNQGSISSLLIKKLQEKEMSNIEEFLTNPLLVSLLFTAFEHKQAIPFKKYLFYRQVYDANFESHDLTKGDSFTHDKYSKLEIDDFHRVLRHIGFSCFKIQKIEFTKDEVLKLITDSKDFCVGLDFKESDFLQDIIKTVPIFTQDGNYYRWSHKSLQEYFAAQFIYLDSKDKQDSILRKIYNHSIIEKFVNVLDLYYDMDYKTFRNVIELNFLEDYENFSNNYLKELTDFTPNEITKRKELMFLTESFLFRATNDNGKNSPFDNKKIGEFINELEKKHKNPIYKFNGILVNPVITNNIYVANYNDSKKIILQLLNNKKNSIVKELKNWRKFPEKIEIDCQFKNDYEFIKISNTFDCILNSKTNFNKVNMILEACGSYSISINEKEALNKLEKIKSDMNLEKENDFLLSGI